MPRADRGDLLERVRALADAEERRRTGCYFAEGVRNLIEADDAATPIEAIVVSERLLKHGAARRIVRSRRAAGGRVYRVSPEEFRSISSGAHASGVGFVARQHWEPLARITPERDDLWLAAGTIRKAGNLGTILRTAEAVGACGLVVSGRDADPFHPGAVRGSMGALFHQRVTRADLVSVRRWADRHGVRIVGASPDGARRFDQLGWTGPTLVLLGDERKGLTSREVATCDELARIPMCGQVDSLNVGVAAGVMLYELYRQRGFGAERRPDGSRAPDVTRTGGHAPTR